MTGSIAVEEALLVLKIAFLVLLYLFIWRIVRTASRDLRLPQESMVLAPHQARQLAGAARPVSSGRLVVLQSPALDAGTERVLDSSPVSVGRGPQNDLRIEGDDFASSLHARFEPRRDGVWIEDVGSTNGTFVNGAALEGAHRLRVGDVVRIGGTDLRYER